MLGKISNSFSLGNETKKVVRDHGHSRVCKAEKSQVALGLRN